jgi:tetratricopeptide (TPR) repeat protein
MKNISLLLLVFITLIGCKNTPEETVVTPKENKPQSSTRKPSTSTSTPRGAIFDSINAVIKAEPQNAAAYAHRADMHLQRRNTQFALVDVQQAFALDSNFAKAYEVYGGIAYTQNKTRESKNAWSKCIELDKENVACRMALAELYIAVKNQKPALLLLNEVIKIDKQNAAAYLMKGVVTRDYLGDTALALNYFQRAVDLDQDNMDALDLMGVTLGNIKDTTALFYYDRMLAINPNRADVYYKKGVLYMSVDEPNRALEAYTRAIQLNPKDAQSLYNLGYMHIELKLYRQAIDFFTRAINAKQRNYQAHYGRGFAYEMLGNPELAKQDYHQSLEILSIYTPAQEALARIKQTDAEVAKRQQQ